MLLVGTAIPVFTAGNVPVIEVRPLHDRVPEKLEKSADASAALRSSTLIVEEAPQPIARV